jgi:hypothetical protein
MLLHILSCRHINFYTHKLLHTEAFDTFTHRRFYTQKLFTQKLLHTDAFAHRRFYTQELLHKEAFTHRSFYTQTLLHTAAFTHRCFYTQTLLTHRRIPFYLNFRRSNLISCEKVVADTSKSQFHRSFWRSNLVSCERVAFRPVSLALPRALREK